MDLFAPHGAIKSTLWPASRKSILRAWAHNEGYCVMSDNARRISKPRRNRGVAETLMRQSRDEAEA